jgi:nicotinate-nucleotide pyrophosphorylase (carboxylating)
MAEIGCYDLKTVRNRIHDWLEEDIGSGDVTSLVALPSEHQSEAIIHTKQAGILAGIEVVESVFREVDPTLHFTKLIADGERMTRGDLICKIAGNTRSILSGERLALNLLQRLSGIATQTRTFVDQLSSLTRAPRIVDTRKTTPGLRVLEKYAVRVGGGHNHRFGLYDAVLLKDNHIKAAGGVARAIRAAKSQIPHTMRIEVEIETFTQMDEAIEAQADIIMLDNMKPERMAEAVRIIRSKAPQIVIEASGGVNMANIREVAETGIDIISIGALTHSVQALDISLDLQAPKEVRE